MTKETVANVIEAFIEGRSGKWDWDEFISLRLSERDLDSIRKLCAKLPEIDPPTDRRHYCGPRGKGIMRQIVNDLRSGHLITPVERYSELNPL